MKIAILTPTFSKFSGIDRLIENKLESYKKSGDKVTIFCFESDISTRLAKVEVLGMPKNSFLQRLYRLFFFLDWKKVNSTAKKLSEFDEVIAHQYPMTLIASKAKKKYSSIKYVYHDAGVAYPWLFRSIVERIYIRIFSFLSYWSIKNADEIVFISGFLRQEMKKKASRDGIVEYVKIDTKRFHKGIDGSRIRKKYSLSFPSLLYVGRISPHKNIHGLIKAFNLVRKHFPDAKLIIVGKQTFGSYMKELESLAKSLPNSSSSPGPSSSVIFTGFVPDKELPEYYAACDLYVTASLWEGFDIPIVEANAVGKKAVAYGIGSHKEVLKDGLLVDELTPEALAEGIIKILQEK